MVGAKIIKRKLMRSTKVRLFTVPCCSIILFSSEGMKKKTYLNLLLTFFVVLVLSERCCSIILFSSEGMKKKRI